MKQQYIKMLRSRYPQLYKSAAHILCRPRLRHNCQNFDGWMGIIDALSSVVLQHNPTVTLAYLDTSDGILILHIFSETSYGEAAAIRAAAYYSQRVCQIYGTPGDFMEDSSGRIFVISEKARLEDDQFIKPSKYPSFSYETEIWCGRALPAASIRMHWNTSEVEQNLRSRWELDKNCRISIPPCMFDLADCAIAAITLESGSRGGHFEGPRPKITYLVWNAVSGLDIGIDKASCIAVVHSEKKRRIEIKWRDQADYSWPILFDRKCLEIDSLRSFVGTMSRSIDIETSSIITR